MIDQENPTTPSSRKLDWQDGKNPAALSPSTTATSYSVDGSPRSITIDHQVSTNHGSTRGRSIGRGFILGMSKPVFALVAATIFATSGSAAWFFSEWLSIPGLKDQISALEVEVTRLEDQVNRLESQVDRLSEEVDVLAYQNDRYSLLNTNLNETAQEYKELNNQLNASTVHLESLNDQLNQSNVVFANLNSQLSSQNEIYAALNQELNQTQEELSALNEDLFTIVGFLNDTSISLQENLESVVEFLSELISVNRLLVLETLKNTYLQRIQNWDCGFRDYFLTEPFIQDGTAPINSNANDTIATVDLVLDYVEDRLLNSLCLDESNLRVYLSQHMPPGKMDLGDLTANEFLQGISRYMALAMNYYFSASNKGGGGSGVSPEDWAEASYQCSNLDDPFRWS